MLDLKYLCAGTFGTIFSTVGSILQTNEILQLIATILTIVGSIISFIVVPLVNWYNTSKKDGKITADEVKEGVEIIATGIGQVKEEIKDEQN